MNYKRGFFRVLIVVSVIWTGTFGYLAYDIQDAIQVFRALGKQQSEFASAARSDMENAPEFHLGGLDKKHYAALAEKYELEAKRNYDVAFKCADDYSRYLTFLVVNPLLLIVFFPIFTWVARGFQAPPAKGEAA